MQIEATTPCLISNESSTKAADLSIFPMSPVITEEPAAENMQIEATTPCLISNESSTKAADLSISPVSPVITEEPAAENMQIEATTPCLISNESSTKAADMSISPVSPVITEEPAAENMPASRTAFTMKKEQDKEMDTTEQFASLVSDCSQTPGYLSPGNSLLSTALGVDNDDAGQAMPGKLVGIIVPLNDGAVEYAMCSDVLAIGSAKSNDIIIPNAADHHALLQASRFGEVFLFHHDTKLLKGRCLKHNETFTVGSRLFKWKYPQEPGRGCLDKMPALLDDVSEQSEVSEIDSCGGVDQVPTGEMDGISICSDVTDSEMDDSFNDPDYVPDSPENKNIDSEDATSLDNRDNNSDSDYVPDSESDDLSDIIAPITSISKLLKSSDNPENNAVDCGNQSDNCENCDVVTASNTSATSDKEDNARIQDSQNSKNRRIWDKIHFCVYCGRSSTNISKHYLGIHKNEDDVKTILELRKGSKERALELERLRNAGDYQHNLDVLSTRKGILVTYARRNDASIDDYLPCEDCLGFFLKDNLWRHRKSCQFKTNETKYSKIQASAKLLLPSQVAISQGLKENVIKRMTNDEITICARNDRIIVQIGENLYQKNGQHPHMAHFISQKMRELARFVIVAKKENPKVNSLNDVIDPCMFKLAIHSTRILCGYNETTHQFANPSLALKIGHQLKKCARIKKSECLMNKSVGREDAENCLTLIESEWTNSISSNALQTITVNKMNKTQILPLTEDIKTLTDHLNQTAENCIANLSHDFSKSDWETLNKVTLTHLVLFNRKRGGEVERLTVENYHNRQTNNKPMPEIESTLSPVEKMLCSRLGRVEIRGKKGRTVAVLLTPEMQKCIDILLKYREKAGVNTKNNFVFARANGESLNPIRMSDTLRTYRSTLNLSAGECLTSTRLRKHIATVSQVLNLSRLDMEVMAEFLGHDIDIHRSFYRLPQSTIQVAKMGKLLTAVNDGTIAKYSGLTLDEISLQEVYSDLSSDEETDDDDGDDDRTAEQEDESGSGLCQGPTESDLLTCQGPTESGLQPCQGSTESALLPHQVPTESVLLQCHGPTETLQKTKKSSSTSALQGKKIQKLTSQQSQLLHQLFCTNIKFRRELKMIDCTNAIKKYKCLNSLSWTKIKNTVHNWITAYKRRVNKCTK